MVYRTTCGLYTLIIGLSIISLKVFPVVRLPLYFNRFFGDIIEGMLETCYCRFVPVEGENDHRLCINCGR
jgi:hypothetical protein